MRRGHGCESLLTSYLEHFSEHLSRSDRRCGCDSTSVVFRFVGVSYLTRLDRFIRNVFYAVVAQWQRITFLQLRWWQVGVAGSTPVDGITVYASLQVGTFSSDSYLFV